MIPLPNEPTASARIPVSSHLDRHPGAESLAYVGNRIRPHGPRRRPLPPTPLSQAVHPGTPAELFSTTGSPSHIPGSSSQSPGGSFIQDPPHFVRSATAPPRPPQPILPSRRTVRVDVSTPSPSHTARNNFASRSSLSQNQSLSSPAFLTSPIRGSFTESVTSPSRRSVQSPPPNFPFHSIPLPSSSTQSRTPPTTHSLLSPPRHIPSPSIPLPPQSTPPRLSTNSRSYASSRPSRQTFRASPVGQQYQSSAWSTEYPEINTSPRNAYHYHAQTHSQPNQEFIYTSSPGVPEQFLSRSPYFAAGFAYLPQAQASYLLPPQSQQPSYEHLYYDGPSMSPPH